MTAASSRRSTSSGTKPRCYSYLRFSTLEQMQGDSIKRQMESARRWADAHSMKIEALTYADLGVSSFRGKNAKKGALSMFLTAIDQGQVKAGDYLLIERVDRLTRQATLDALDLVRKIIDKGVKVVTATDGVEYSTRTINDEPGRIYQLLGAIQAAHLESKARSDRASSAWRAKHEAMLSGKRVRHKCPAWLRWVPKKQRYEVIEPHASTIQRVFELAWKGEGAQIIARTINDEQRPIFGPKKCAWSADYINNLIELPTVTGQHQPTRKVDGKIVPIGEPITDYYPRVVSLRTYRAVQQIRLKRTFKRGKSQDRASNLLTSRIYCSSCGSSMFLHRSGPAQPDLNYYVCRGRKRGSGCSQESWRQHRLEAVLLGNLIGVLAKAIEHDDNSAASTNLTALEERLAEIVSKHDTLAQRIADPKFPAHLMGQTYDMLTDLDKQRQQIQEEIDQAKDEASPQQQQERRDDLLHMQHLTGKLDDIAARLELKMILARAVKRVEVHDMHLLVTLASGNTTKVTDWAARYKIKPVKQTKPVKTP